MGKPLVRIDRDVFHVIAKSAAAAERSIPKELNRLLRELLIKKSK